MSEKKQQGNGKIGSGNGGMPSKKANYPSPELEKLLAKVFDSLHGELREELGSEAYQQRRRDFVFHLTDWLKDLNDLHELFSHPEKIAVDEAAIFLIGMLSHVVPHINAAGKLMLGKIPDPFAKKPKRKSIKA